MDCIKSVDHMGNIAILATFSLPIHEHRMFFHLFGSYFNNLLQLSGYNFCTSFVKLIPKYFVIFVPNVN